MMRCDKSVCENPDALIMRVLTKEIAIIKEYLDVEQISKLLGINQQTVRKFARKGILPAIKIGREWRFSNELIEKYISDGSIVSKMKNVLVIDDVEKILDLLDEILGKLSLKAYLASSSKQGLDILEKEKIDLVFVDMQMPVMNGLETIKKIRELYGLIPIVILTSFPEINMVAEASKYTPVTLISKPFSVDQIESCVSFLINS